MLNRHKDNMKVIVTGCRDYKNTKHIEDVLNNSPFEITELITGGAPGVDAVAFVWGLSKGLPQQEFLAEWDKYFKYASSKRNTEMAEYADALIAFWDGKSPGTRSMINIAEHLGLKVKIIMIDV